MTSAIFISTIPAIISKTSPQQTLFSLFAKPSLGDEIVVLWLPVASVQEKVGLTATEGIVSGFDGNYFITSAKVEQGTGGAAILLKDTAFWAPFLGGPLALI